MVTGAIQILRPKGKCRSLPSTVTSLPALGTSLAASMSSMQPQALSSGGGGIATNNAMATLAAVSGRVKEYGAQVFKQRKPWSEVVDRSAFSKPANLAEAASRIRKNANYFKVNYLIVMLLTTLLSFLLHPSSLIAVALLCTAWLYMFLIRTTPLTIGGRTFSEREKLLGMVAISVVTIFFLTNVGTVLFSALSIGAATVVAHGATREPDNLFIDEGESQQGLLSIFAVPTASGMTSQV